MSKSVSITLPDRLLVALKNEADQWEQSVPEFVRTFMIQSAQSPSGAVLKLKLPPASPDAEQPLLPLGGARHLAES